MRTFVVSRHRVCLFNAIQEARLIVQACLPDWSSAIFPSPVLETYSSRATALPSYSFPGYMIASGLVHLAQLWLKQID